MYRKEALIASFSEYELRLGLGLPLVECCATPRGHYQSGMLGKEWCDEKRRRDWEQILDL